MIKLDDEIKTYIKDKRPTTTFIWSLCALFTLSVVIISATINWQFGHARGGNFGGLVAVALDILLFTFGIRTWRKHHGFNTIVDGALIVLLMLVGVLCVVGFFTIESDKAGYDFTVSKNSAMSKAVSSVGTGMSEKSRLDTNYLNNKLIKNMVAPQKKDQRLFEQFASYSGLGSADNASFAFNSLMGIVLVLGSVLATTRLNSYYCPFLLSRLRDSVEQNNKVINHKKSTTDTDPEISGTQDDEPKVRQNQRDKFNKVSGWIESLKSGDRIYVDEAKKEGDLNAEQWRQIKKELINTDVIRLDDTIAVDRYFKV